MEAFRRIDVERRYPMYSNAGGRFNIIYEGKRETEILRSEPERFRNRAEERIKAIDLAIKKARAARISK